MAGASNIRVVLSSLEVFTENIIKKMALDMVANLRKPGSEGGTPVDTGWARANWLTQVGSPATGTVGSRESVNDTAAQARVAGLASYKLSAGPVFITNNVDYILSLNDGTSNQAPSGFVQAAITAAVARTAA